MGIELPRAVRSRSSPLTCTAHRRGLGPRARETPRVCGANLVSAVRAVTVEKATNVASGRVRPWRDPRGTTESARTSWHKIRLLSGRSELGAGRGVAASGWCMWVWARVFERNMRPGWRIVRWEGWCSHKDSSNKGNLYSLSLSLPSFLSLLSGPPTSLFYRALGPPSSTPTPLPPHPPPILSLALPPLSSIGLWGHPARPRPHYPPTPPSSHWPSHLSLL